LEPLQGTETGSHRREERQSQSLEDKHEEEERKKQAKEKKKQREKEECLDHTSRHARNAAPTPHPTTLSCEKAAHRSHASTGQIQAN